MACMEFEMGKVSCCLVLVDLKIKTELCLCVSERNHSIPHDPQAVSPLRIPCTHFPSYLLCSTVKERKGDKNRTSIVGGSEEASMAGPVRESDLTPKDTFRSKGGRLGHGHLCT